MEKCKLGVIKEVPVRSIWEHEQYDFSNWLAKESNIALLNDLLGLTLTDIKREVYVGPYRCDIVARDETSGIQVVIENQLEQTNHDHLGKIITYASGLDAGVVVWIAKKAKSEHSSAIEWLNNKTDSSVAFFLLEIHAYKIGDSLPAPMFKIVEVPNDFRKTTQVMNRSGENNRTHSERIGFWNQFNEVIEERKSPFNTRVASTDHWYDVSIGTSAAHISITLVQRKGKVGIEIYIRNNKGIFEALKEERETIEKELNCELTWMQLEGKSASRIISYIDGLNFDDHSNYPELMNAIIDRVVLFKKVFAKRIKEYLETI